MFNPHPRVVVLGGPVPAPLAEALTGNIEFVSEDSLGTEPFSGVLVHARSEALSAVRRFREAGGALPIYGLAEGVVPVPTRLLWIREGADDLLTTENAAAVLVRRIRGGPTRALSANEAVPIGVRLDRYLVALNRYLALRKALIQRLGDNGQQKLMECANVRDQVMRAADAEVPLDAFGQRRGSEREELSWAIRLFDERAGEGELLNVGADGFCIAIKDEPRQGELLRLEIDGLSLSALIEGDARWRRQSEPGRWEVGVYATMVTLQGTG